MAFDDNPSLTPEFDRFINHGRPHPQHSPTDVERDNMPESGLLHMDQVCKIHLPASEASQFREPLHGMRVQIYDTGITPSGVPIAEVQPLGDDNRPKNKPPFVIAMHALKPRAPTMP